ncbi:MAG: division/cell wall cluster transcriptional repressor MraZ [Clostridia bacterium]|nr:division/cell wall cluster transcriptional repressor MraZ [Clostridia bacterium]
MFIGEYEHSVDAKGRVIMPAKLRDDIGEKFIITKGLDGCLFAYSLDEWTNFESKLKTLPLTNKNARDFVRFFLSGAVECEIDKQGRFLIPNNLRTYATLEKEINIIGVGTRIEIWNREKWEKYSSEENISADDIAENMTMLGI